MRIIPKEDMIIFRGVVPNPSKVDKDFKDGVFCPCGNTIFFKNRKSYETVKVICPDCNFEIIAM